MKKSSILFIGIICCVMFVFFVGIRFEKIGGNSIQEEKKEKVNYVDYNETKEVKRLDINTETMATSAYMSEEKYIKNAEFIVKGEIQKIQYCEYMGTPWRRLIVRVMDVIEGDIEQGEEIIVYLLGGYLSSKEYYSYFFDEAVPKGKEQILYNIEMRPEESIMSEEDTEIFLLEQASEDSPFESTAFESVGGYDSEYLYDERKDQYKQYKENGEEVYWNESKLYEKLKG